MNYFVEYNGVKNSDVNIYATRPNIPAAIRKNTVYKLPGVDGDLYGHEDAVEDITIDVKFGFFGPPDKWMDMFRGAKKWLLTKLSGKLVFSDDPEFFYKVKTVSINTATRTVKTIGEFTASFVCEGYQYLKSGAYECGMDDVKYNPYSLSKPVYRITGEGMCNLVVNGKTMTANVGQEIIINTDTMLAYRSNGTLQNTLISGDYENLWLVQGENTVSITSGFALSIIPNWRCI